MSEPTRRKGRGCFFGCIILAILAVFLPVLTWLIADSVTRGRVEADLNRLRKAGEPVDLEDFGGKLSPRVPAGVDNAASLYQEAFSVRRDPAGMKELSSYWREKWTASDWQTVRDFLATNQQYFQLLDQASRIQQCDFPVNWEAGDAALFPHFATLREAARGLTIRAEVELAGGNVEGAVASCATTLRIAKHTATTPNLIGQLVAVAIQSIGLKELARVLSIGTPSALTCRRLFAESDNPARNHYWLQTMRGERVLGLDTFERVRNGTYAPEIVEEDFESSHTYPTALMSTVGRPWLNLDHQQYLQIMDGWIATIALPWPEAKAEADKLQAREKQLPSYCMLSACLLPYHARALDSRDKEAAELGAARIALAAKAHKGERGSYSASLADLTKASWKLPLDPFTGKSYLYRREGPGFAVWSTGPDLKDNNAHEVDWSHDKMSGSGYDFVFRCAK